MVLAGYPVADTQQVFRQTDLDIRRTQELCRSQVRQGIHMERLYSKKKRLSVTGPQEQNQWRSKSNPRRWEGTVTVTANRVQCSRSLKKKINLIKQCQWKIQNKVKNTYTHTYSMMSFIQRLKMYKNMTYGISPRVHICTVQKCVRMVNTKFWITVTHFWLGREEITIGGTHGELELCWYCFIY